MQAIIPWIVLLSYMAPCIFAHKCLIENSVEQKVIKEMIDTQGYFCSIPVKILNKETVTEVCDRWALVFEVDGLLEKLNFPTGTSNANNKNTLIKSYNDCLDKVEYEVLDAVTSYLQTVNLNPIEILQRVNDSLHKLHHFSEDPSSASKCESYYKEHGQNDDVTKGPQCACPSPTTPIFSSATSQPSLSSLTEIASRTYTSSYTFQASPLAEDMSVSYPGNLMSPQKNSHGFDSSPFISTDMPNNLKSLTTIVDYTPFGSTGQSGDHTDISLTSTEFTKGIPQPSFISLKPSQTRTDPGQVNKDVSNSDTENMHESEVPSTTIENQSIPTHPVINGEISTVTDPDEIRETTTLSSQSSMGSMFQHSFSVPSEEPGIEMSSSSVTKIRRSIVDMDPISRATLATQAISGLSISTNDPNHPSLNSVHTNIPSSRMSLSNTEAPESMSQGKVIKDNDLGWASSYLSSTMQTSKTEPSMSSSVPGGHLLLSDATHNPVLNALTLHNILSTQERNIANDDKQSFSALNHGSNILPIIATEQFEDGRKKEHGQNKLPLIIIVILVMLVLLFLCGLLYYRRQYQALQRRLNISYGLDLDRTPGPVLPEERVPLPIIECDIV